jgi:hypothetical protein
MPIQVPGYPFNRVPIQVPGVPNQVPEMPVQVPKCPFNQVPIQVPGCSFSLGVPIQPGAHSGPRVSIQSPGTHLTRCPFRSQGIHSVPGCPFQPGVYSGPRGTHSGPKRCLFNRVPIQVPGMPNQVPGIPIRVPGALDFVRYQPRYFSCVMGNEVGTINLHWSCFNIKGRSKVYYSKPHRSRVLQS